MYGYGLLPAGMIIIDGISVHLGVMASLGASQFKELVGAMDFFSASLGLGTKLFTKECEKHQNKPSLGYSLTKETDFLLIFIH